MMIAHVSNGFLVFGLTREDADRMIAGEPIRITAATHPVPEGCNVILMFGEDGDDLRKQLLKHFELPMSSTKAH